MIVEAVHCGTLKRELGDPITKEGFENVIEHIKKQCAEEFSSDKSLEPCFFILFEENGRNNMLMMPVGKYFSSVSGKNLVAELVRTMSDRVNAYATVFASEAWMAMTHLEKDDPRTDEEIRQSFPESLADLPEDERLEVINLMIEHNKFGSNILTAVIDRSSGEPVLGEFGPPPGMEDKADDTKPGLTGRMTGFIGATRKDRN